MHKRNHLIFTYKILSLTTILLLMPICLSFSLTQYQDGGIVPSGGNIGITGNLGVGTTSPSSKLQVTGGTTSLEQSAWTAVTFTNSWANYGGGFQPASYFKDSAGIVHLKGLVASGTVTTTMFTLPAGYRPVEQLLFNVISNGAVGRVDISTAGAVTAVAGSNAWLQLDGITFRADE